MKILIIFMIVAVSLIAVFGLVSATNIKFFYSDSCPHCQKMKPIVQNYINLGIGEWELKNMNNELNSEEFTSYEFTGVPAFIINTNDGREIKVVGADSKRLNCELQEMSTKECITYSADHSIGESWFK